MKLTPRERALAKFAKDYYDNKSEIDELVKKLLLNGEKHADIAKLTSLSPQAIYSRAEKIGAPKNRKEVKERVLDKMRTALIEDFEIGDLIWGQAEACQKFKTNTIFIKEAKKALAAEGLIKPSNPKYPTIRYRRAK